MTKDKRTKFSFFPFLFFSACVHLTAFYFIHTNSLWFYSPIKENKTTQNKIALPKKEKDKILKQFVATISNKYQPSSVSKKKENLVGIVNFSDFNFEEREDIIEKPAKINPGNSFPVKLADSKKTIPSNVNLATNNKEKYLKELKAKTDFVPFKYYAKQDKCFKTTFEGEKEHTFPDLISLNENNVVFQEKSVINNKGHALPTKLIKKKPTLNLKKYDLAKKITFPTLRDLRTYLYADDFDMEVTHIKSKKEKGYIFAITLIPKQDIDLPRIPQHYTLLIDRSNVIQKNRLKASRDALYQSISFLKEEDSFNIIAFDNKMEKLFPTKRKLSDESKKLARKFLINLKLGSFFASTNVYNPLYSSAYDNLNEQHIHSIILMSNGDGLTSKALEHHFMGQWTKFNSGRISLFSVSMQDDEQVADLEVVSTLNRGWLVTSSTKGGIKRKMLKLMKTIQNPIIKDVECSYISTTGNVFELFRPHKGLPHLYKSEPYVIIGKCKKLEDFTLVLQGKNKDKWLNVKKSIPLSSSKRGDSILLEQWALHKAWNYYSDYLNEHNYIYLEKARKILEPFDISPAFK